MRLNILLLSNQIRGIDGTGGLGDVPVGLAKALLARGDIDIRLAMPGYTEITAAKELPDRFNGSPLETLEVPFGLTTRRVEVYETRLPRSNPPIICYLFRCQDVFDGPDPVTGKPNKNTPDKAVLFARSALEFLRAHEQFRVDLIHCNDWQTGLLPVYLRTLYRADPYLGRVATLYTTHNAGGDAYQGGFDDRSLLSLAGLEAVDVFEAGRTKSLRHNDKFNFSKGGFGFADLLNTVSRQYRNELMTSAFAGGLEGLFQERQLDFCGIVNGIDTEEWDPANDEFVPGYPFSKDSKIELIRTQKRRVRAALREWTVNDERHPRFKEKPFTSLEEDSILVGAVTRIDYQKVPILLAAIDRITNIPRAQIALLGNADTNDDMGRSFEAELLSRSKGANGRLLFFDGFNIPLSHLIYAASEIFLVPSVFEPCGLTQLVAMRYGAVPVVRSVGGLADTVIDEQGSGRRGDATGFCYKGAITRDSMLSDLAADADAFVACLHRAFKQFDSERWAALTISGMHRDSSWSIPSRQYVALYHEALRRHVHEEFFRI